MSIIINPNAPPPRKPDGLDMILDTMRVIAHYRQSFFQLEALKQSDGVSQPATARELLLINEEQQVIMQSMVEFILYGADKNDRIKSTYQDRRPSAADIENHAQGATQKESADWHTLLAKDGK